MVDYVHQPIRFPAPPFFVCRTCLMHISVDNNVLEWHPLSNTVLIFNGFNLASITPVYNQLLGTTLAVEVFCSGCMHLLGWHIVDLEFEYSLGALMSGSYILILGQLSHWDGLHLVDGLTVLAGAVNGVNMQLGYGNGI